MKRLINLKDIINIEAFQKIQDDIAKAAGVAIITTDYKGKPVTKHSCCTEFCNIVRADSKLAQLCEKCDSRGGLESARTGKPYIYRCHNGLVDFAVPIIVEEQYLGSIMAGQVLTEEKDLLNLENVAQIDSNIKKNHKLLYEYKKLPIISLEKIKSIAQMMFHISNYIAEEGIFKITQQELNETNNKITKSQMNQMKIGRELEKYRLKSLHSQINPHFVFNILNNIYSSALIENAPNTSQIAFKLSKMIRNNFEKSNKIVTIEEEIKHIKSYINLQKIRFGKRLDFHVDLKDEYKNIRIPFMTIYPFVENSILHGLRLKEEGGYIKILVQVEQDFISISIIDNGLGITEEQLKKINQEKENTSFLCSGIESAKQRIINFYRYEYSINIESNYGNGTKVIIKLPKEL